LPFSELPATLKRKEGKREGKKARLLFSLKIREVRAAKTGERKRRKKKRERKEKKGHGVPRFNPLTG